ncbi:membrane protein [Luteimonas mephitis]|uniref:COG4705 family protein n=1 Tax=Luteimonas mephitis TaxID=83615 RepID=UPI00040C57B7|nr:membrane protein [Luteimonas mephitis]
MNKDALAKVPEVTIGFWIIKVLVTTLGETGGDAVTMSMQLGYAAGSVIFLLLFVATVAAQVGARRFHPYLYWAAIIASTTVGTTLADLVDRSLGIGYAGGSTLLALALLASLALWKRSTGSVDMGSVDSRKAESFYWVTILFSQTLGTALGDWTADTAGLGYAGSAMVFGSLLLLVALAYFRTGISRTVLFWAAFVLTRPLGAVVGDFLDKPLQQGGLDVSRYAASAALLGLVAMLVLALPHRAAQRAH